MRCKKIQNLLKSDYLDGNLNLLEQKEVLKHLERCDQCRVLEKELRGQREFFQKMQKQNVSGQVWQNIKQEILKKQLERETYSGVFERLKEFLFPSHRVLALVSAATAVIIVMALAGSFIRGRNILNEEKDAAILAEYAINIEDQELLSGLGTNIEEYFL
ncbi:MAG: zf-HC2 domain-containing protein [Candidatus Omnitrophota bacterium]